MILGEEDGRARIYVPAKRHEALIEAHHVAINHLGPVKTYASLHRNYTWATARADVRKHYDQCPFCELSKARHNQSIRCGMLYRDLHLGHGGEWIFME